METSGFDFELITGTAVHDHEFKYVNYSAKINMFTLQIAARHVKKAGSHSQMYS